MDDSGALREVYGYNEFVDSIKGFTDAPETFNQYNYCLNSPFVYVDLDGQFILGAIAAVAVVGAVASAAINLGTQVVKVSSG